MSTEEVAKLQRDLRDAHRLIWWLVRKAGGEISLAERDMDRMPGELEWGTLPAQGVFVIRAKERTPPGVAAEIACPRCKGTGHSLLPRCTWCGGSGKVSGETALRYADHMQRMAECGYIHGDDSFEDLQRVRREARQIREEVRGA